MVGSRHRGALWEGKVADEGSGKLLGTDWFKGPPEFLNFPVLGRVPLRVV